jgi:hypothetical protein
MQVDHEKEIEMLKTQNTTLEKERNGYERQYTSIKDAYHHL